MRSSVITPAVIILLVLSFGGAAGAQGHGLPAGRQGAVDPYRLTKLYERLLEEQGRPPEEREEAAQAIQHIEKRIAEERESLRLLIESEFNGLVSPKDDEETFDPTKALDRQREIVSALQDRLEERKADLSLLEKEEELYRRGVLTATGKTAGVVQLTESYPELLAQKAVLEERIDILGQMVSRQEERAGELRAQQRWKDVLVLLTILAYIAIFLGALWAERLIRTRVFTHIIPHRAVRYAVTKAFTLIVYLFLIFWFAQEILSEYPTVLTAFAFIGAAAIVAMQDMIKGFFGWLTQAHILTVGNRVTIGTPTGFVTGDVVDVSVLYTTLLLVRSPDMENIAQVGKTVRIPNACLLLHAVVSYNSTSDFIRAELPVTVADAAKWRQAKDIFERVIREEADEFFEAEKEQVERRTRKFYFPPEFHAPSVFAELKDDGVLITLCFTVPLRRRREIVTNVTERLLQECAAAGIALASAPPHPRQGGRGMPDAA